MKKIIIIQIVISTFIFGCTNVVNKEKLVQRFVDMRKIPSKLISITKRENYEIAYQDEDDISERYNYPNNFSVGKLNKQKDDYDYVVYLNGISPIEEFEYVKEILEKFETDSTYISVIIKEENFVKANIYRKVNKIEKTNLEFIMWKWVKIQYGKIEFKTVETMNQHLF